MNRFFIFLSIIIVSACKSKTNEVITAQSVVDKSIEVSGGALYKTTTRSFVFRDIEYISENKDGKQILKRIIDNDTSIIVDILNNQKFERYINDKIVQVADSMAVKYSNSINSVHYFANLPFGLNDPAVKKELLGEVQLNGKNYHKVKVTFEQKDGGVDYDDTYVYWFNSTTFKPEYLAYEYHTDEGGMRFREAFNERNVNGIRFVDYNNYKTKDMNVSILKIDSLFESGSLELLSKIELKNIEVNLDSYN
ncbi:deoxyribose-phosphate aldolase [Aurantibacter crassamenti]|uniref:DUF6503 family protein n=1 Tax=Aurantibacter crassamenti TaxID=1837375 RepID=UPI001939F0C5|nr:DUF6503 family protein [Aurantibacter crassamenti]MBM1107463.1 deoxyribose-phosphate aldolase [Aurantibacter crassamenti]